MKHASNSKVKKFLIFTVSFFLISCGFIYSSSFDSNSKMSAFCREITHIQKKEKSNFVSLNISNNELKYYSKDDYRLFREKELSYYRFVYSKNNKAQFFTSQSKYISFFDSEEEEHKISSIYPYHLTTKLGKLEFLDIPLLCQNEDNLNYRSQKYSGKIPVVIPYKMAMLICDNNDPLTAIDKTITLVSNINGNVDYREVVVWNIAVDKKDKKSTSFNNYLTDYYNDCYVILNKPIFNEKIMFNVSLGNDVYLNKILINDSLSSFKNHLFSFETVSSNEFLNKTFAYVCEYSPLPIIVFGIIYVVLIAIIYFLIFKTQHWHWFNNLFLNNFILLFINLLSPLFMLLLIEFLYKKTGLFIFSACLNKYSILFVLVSGFVIFFISLLLNRYNRRHGGSDYETSK